MATRDDGRDDGPDERGTGLTMVPARRQRRGAVPGFVISLEGGRAGCRAFDCPGRELTVGRSAKCDVVLSDPAVSGVHLVVGRANGRPYVEDRGGRSGVTVDGVKITERTDVGDAVVIGLGDSLLYVCDDVGPFDDRGVDVSGDYAVGPAHAIALEAVGRAARSGDSLLILGESGTGKERAARDFHRSIASQGAPFVHVNCSTLRTERAAADLFGVKRGAFTGSTHDSDGWIASADGGTVFFDEVGDMALEVQPQLLVAMESGEVRPLGGDRPRRVQVRYVSATDRDLDAMKRDEKFREAFYGRIAQQQVRIPPLRERREEIPYILEIAAREVWKSFECDPIPLHPALVGACMVLSWRDGNVRRLRRAIKTAATAAVTEGAENVSVEFLPEWVWEAGTDVAGGEDPRRAALVRALLKHGGNMERAARELGLSRSQGYRVLDGDKGKEGGGKKGK